MSKENNIVLISANEDFSEKLAEKIVLLRKTDRVITSGYVSALNMVRENNARVVLLHADGVEKTLNLIKELHNLAAIILLADDNELILEAYDSGITDFCPVNAPDYELVIRIVNCIKSASDRLNLKRAERLLIQNQILDKDTGFYTYKYAQQVINNETQTIETGTFVVVAPAENSKPIFSTDKMAKAVKQSIRTDDIVTFGKGAKFYLLLPYTNIDGAAAVVEKIKSACPENFEIKAGFSDIAGKDFVYMEKEGLKALLDAMYSDNTYVVGEFQEETLEDWLDEETAVSKNYKLFKQVFGKKLQKVIIPVFYRLQKTYEEKLPDSTIFQFADNEQCVFHIKNKYQDSKLKIIYPGFAKITISIIHQGLDSPENREITLPLSKITQKDLIKIVEDFIEEFKSVAVQ